MKLRKLLKIGAFYYLTIITLFIIILFYLPYESLIVNTISKTLVFKRKADPKSEFPCVHEYFL